MLSMDGTVLSEKKPSKEWPLHLALYEKSSETGAVIHTHSTFSVLWSFVPAKNDQDCIPDHTPYLENEAGNRGTRPLRKARLRITVPGIPGAGGGFRRLPVKKSWTGRSRKICHGCLFSAWRSWRKAPGSPGSFSGPVWNRKPALQWLFRFSALSFC